MKAACDSAPSCILPKHLEDKRTIRVKNELFKQDICTNSYSDHVAISAFTSVLWRRPFAPSVILFIPENREQITWFLLFYYITVSPGLAQHLLAIVQHEISRAKMKQSAEHEWGERKKLKLGRRCTQQEARQWGRMQVEGSGPVRFSHCTANELTLILENQLHFIQLLL